MIIARRVFEMAALAVLTFCVPGTVRAQDTTAIKFGYVTTLDQLPFYVAQTKGYFQKAGLNIELVPFNTGPAVESAVAGGSVSFGFASIIPILVAHEANQPFRTFAAFGWESNPNDYTTFMVASSKSGITKMSDIANKKVALNTSGGGCEFLLRTQLATANVPYESLKVINMPFPLIEPALQIGNVDAACTVEPFYSSILLHDPGAKVIGKGSLPPGTRKSSPIGVLFAKTEWLNGHNKEVKAINRAIEQALHDMDSDPKIARGLMVSVMHLEPQLAERVNMQRYHPVSLSVADAQTVIDNAFHNKLIQSAYPASDVVFLPR